MWSYIYSMPKPSDKSTVRAEKLKCSTKARQHMNHKAATKKLEMLLSANFTNGDLKGELTYSNEPTFEDSKIIMRQFWQKLKKVRNKNGQPLKYIYVTEHRHARLHHHIVLSSACEEDLEIIKKLWVHGEIVEVEYLRGTNFNDLAYYLTKENKEDKELYTRRWNSSLNLEKPIVETRYASSDETVDAPIGAEILERDSYRNEFGEYIYVKYILPVKPKAKRKRE